MCSYFVKVYETFVCISTFFQATYIVKDKTPWHEFVSELYQPSDRRLSAKLVPTFAD
jgi:hypothetical protein